MAAFLDSADNTSPVRQYSKSKATKMAKKKEGANDLMRLTIGLYSAFPTSCCLRRQIELAFHFLSDKYKKACLRHKKGNSR